MHRPTPEDFAKAPLFRPYAGEADEPGFDYSAERMIIEGFELVRTDLDEGGFRYALEGIDVLEVLPKVEFGAAVWVGSYFDGKEYRVYEADRTIAAVEFAGEVYERITQRDDALVFHMESRGVPIGREVAPAWVDDEDGDPEDYEGGDVAEVAETFGAPVRILREGFRAWVQGEDESRAWGEIRDGFARADEDGTPVCPAAYPILRQLQAIQGMGDGVFRHREDLKSLRGMIGNPGDIADQGLRMDVHMFDMVDSDLKDDVVPQAAIAAYREAKVAEWIGVDGPAPAGNAIAVADPTAVPAPRIADRPIEDAIREATGFSVGTFQELRAMPDYMREQIRATVRPLFREIFGEDFPMERVVVGRPARDPEAYAAFMYFFQDGELVRDVGPITFPHMPGYRTSPAEVRRRDGWDTLVFSDSFGTYAYSVPSPRPANAFGRDNPDHREDDDPRDRPMV